MQAIWKGAISFGLVSIPIKVYSATEERDVSFRQVHEKDTGRIRYKRVCEVDGQEVPYSDIAKGYELPDGRIVVLSNEDLSQLPLPSAKSIEVLEFVPAEQVDPLYFSKAYYLAADGPGAKPYVLLRDALTKTGQCALVKVAIRTRESLALLRERDGALVLQTMLWPDEVRSSDFAVPADDVSVRPQEVAMAESYIATLKGDFVPEQYHSEYREALEELIEAKVSGLPMPEQPEDQGESAQVLDLVAALRASVDAAKKRRGGSDAASTDSGAATSGSRTASKRSSGKKASAKKAPTKKASGRTTAAKKSATKKTAAKKTASTSRAKTTRKSA